MPRFGHPARHDARLSVPGHGLYLDHRITIDLGLQNAAPGQPFEV